MEQSGIKNLKVGTREKQRRNKVRSRTENGNKRETKWEQSGIKNPKNGNKRGSKWEQSGIQEVRTK